MFLLYGSLIGCGGPPPPTPPQPEAPVDLLIVTFDTTRADHLGCYGYPRETSPFIDELAREGVLFERFVVPQSTTLPTHLSLFTGLLPEEHGVVANTTFTGERYVPPKGLLSVSTWAGKIGYQTAAFVSSTPLKRTSGIAAGFDHFDQPGRASRLAKDTTEAAIAWLDKASTDQPILLWVHYYDPHSPHKPIDALQEKFNKRSDDLIRHVRARDYAPGKQSYDQSFERLNNYDAEILYTDAWFGRLLEAWDTTRRDRSVVVLAGDHGEGLMQHGHLDHGLVWDEQLHAPLIVRAPGLAPRRFRHPVQAVDVLPTLLGLVDLPDEDKILDQVSGADVLAASWTPTAVFSRSSARQTKLGEDLTWSLTTDRWKFHLESDGRHRLYDLRKDPHELTDVARQHPQLVADLEAELVASLARQRERAKALGAGKTEKLDAQTVQELKEMGYME